jgi:hypothetical protein
MKSIPALPGFLVFVERRYGGWGKGCKVAIEHGKPAGGDGRPLPWSGSLAGFDQRSMRRFVALDGEMLDGERSIMRGHLFVMTLRDWISRGFGATLEHLSLFLQQFGSRHDALPSNQTGDVKNGGADHSADGPEGGIPAFRVGTVVFEGRHDMVSNLIGASTVPLCFRTTTPAGQNGFVGRLSARNRVIGPGKPFARPRPAAGRASEMPCLQKALFGKGLGRHFQAVAAQKRRLLYGGCDFPV